MSTDHEVGADRPQEKTRSVLSVVRTAPRPVWVLVTGVFLNRAGSFFATFLVLFLRQLGFTPREMPLILLAVGVATPLGSLLGGWASDRLSRKVSLVGSTLLASGGLAVVGLSPDRTVALGGVFFTALFAQAYLPAASALLVDHTEERDRVPIFAFFRLALNLGSTLGPLIAAAVASGGVRPLFVISSCCYALFGLLLWTGLPAAP
ncbi:MFS transporter, partial [Streptomyces macrosporus]|uniref:MFS transporter n=1 Tax=Streptomyces macrosporus TaxID=44032 RepID=UPI0031DDDA95